MPEGDFFTALGITLLDEQLRDIARIGADAQAEKYTVARLEQALDEGAGCSRFSAPGSAPNCSG